MAALLASPPSTAGPTITGTWVCGFEHVEELLRARVKDKTIFHPGIMGSMFRSDVYLKIDQFLQTVRLRKGFNIVYSFPLDGTPKKYVPIARAFTSGTARCVRRSYTSISFLNDVPGVLQNQWNLELSECRTRLWLNACLMPVDGDQQRFSLEFIRSASVTGAFFATSSLIVPKRKRRPNRAITSPSLSSGSDDDGSYDAADLATLRSRSISEHPAKQKSDYPRSDHSITSSLHSNSADSDGSSNAADLPTPRSKSVGEHQASRWKSDYPRSDHSRSPSDRSSFRSVGAYNAADLPTLRSRSVDEHAASGRQSGNPRSDRSSSPLHCSSLGIVGSYNAADLPTLRSRSIGEHPASRRKSDYPRSDHTRSPLHSISFGSVGSFNVADLPTLRSRSISKRPAPEQEMRQYTCCGGTNAAAPSARHNRFA